MPAAIHQTLPSSLKALKRSPAIALLVSAFLATPVTAQTPGQCEHGVATRDLDIANVRAAIYTNGNLFSQRRYEVPKGSGINAGYVSTLLVGGNVDGQLRVSASTYGRYQFWPGPVSEDSSAPLDCSEFDRIWKIDRSDIEVYKQSGVSTADLAEWPTGLGAPTLSSTNSDGSPTDHDGADNDADGVVDERGEMRSVTEELLARPLSERADRLINLAAGELPDLLGDQMLWWIMNDVGNEHIFTDGNTTESSAPIGLEVHATAFAFDATGVLGNTTFYRYRIFNKGPNPIEDAYVGLFQDMDIGNVQDDYVGSDTTLGLAITFNADNDDETSGLARGYGVAPPAIATDFLFGPVIPAGDNETAQTINGPVQGSRNVQMSSFVYYQAPNFDFNEADPRFARDYYRYLQGVWKDGSPIRRRGDGYNTTESVTTRFMYAGDAATRSFWSEYDVDGIGTSSRLGDRRYIMSTGPFDLDPSSGQDILVGIVWARGGNNVDSYTDVKVADRKVQRFVDSGFYEPGPPDDPVVVASEFDQSIILTWTNPPSSNNILDTYREYAPLGDVDNPYYDFEGYEIWEFDTDNARWPSCADRKQCRLLHVFDVDNGIKEVAGDDDGDQILNHYAFGLDSGVRHSVELADLVNYRTRHFGVRAYAYNVDATPLVLFSPFARVTATPSRRGDVVSVDALAASKSDSTFDLVATVVGVGDGVVAADVVDPARIRPCEYRVVFGGEAGTSASTVFSDSLDIAGTGDVDIAPVRRRAAGIVPSRKGDSLTGKRDAIGQTYDIFCGEERVLDGSNVPGGPPFTGNVGVIDGLEFSILDVVPGIKTVTVVANAGGTIEPPQTGMYSVDDSGVPNGFPMFGNQRRPTRGVQQANSNAVWGMAHGGGFDATYGTFRSRVLRNDDTARLGAFDYEMRFTAAGGMATRAFDDGVDISVPFELWRTGIGTPDDVSDDVRLIPYICEEACRAGTVGNQYDIGGDHQISGGPDDPLTDWVYWYLPEDLTPGESGYDAWFALTGDEAGELFARTVLVQLDGGSSPPYDPPLPEQGTVFRISMSKPFQAGDVATFSTVGLEPTEPGQSEKVARMDDIGLVPNPYRGTSRYETSTLKDEVRFTNLPDVATIRVFTLNGRLVRTIYKNIPGQEWLSWDLRSDSGRHLASGIYLVHVEVPGIGTHVIKFGYVGKRWGD